MKLYLKGIKELHIEENKIEMLILSPMSFSEIEKKDILLHLGKCNLCHEIYETYIKIYEDIHLRDLNDPTVNDEEIAKKIHAKFHQVNESKLLSENSEAVQIYNGKTEIVTRRKLFSLQNIFYFVKSYPAPSFGFVIVSALAIAFIVGQVKNTIKDKNPVFADVKSGALNIYNNSWEALWKKAAYGIPELKSEMLSDWGFPFKRHVNISDIDSDNKNEVLVSGDFTDKGLYRTDSLYCYNFDGTKRWVTGPENIHSGSIPNWKRTEWLIQDYLTINTRGNKRLFLVANDWTYALTLVSEIDPKNGQVLSSIYHSGWFFSDLLLDLDNDGNDEIILSGTSNDYYRPVIMVLRAGGFKGAIDKSELLNPNDNHKGNALYYLLLPVTNYHQKYASSGVVELREIRKTDKGFTVITFEVQPKNVNGTFGLVYSFDKNMQIRNIIPTNWFQKQYNDLYEKGVFKEPLDSNYFQNLKNSILYWDGDKFVNYPTKNKYYTPDAKVERR